MTGEAKKLGGVTGKGFQPGRSGNPSGRPKRRTDFENTWHKFLTSKEYEASVRRRILAGRAPQLEVYVLSIVFGRPEQTITFRGEVARPRLGVGLIDAPAIDAEVLNDR